MNTNNQSRKESLVGIIRDDFRANPGILTRLFLLTFRVGHSIQQRRTSHSLAITKPLWSCLYFIWGILYRLVCHSYGCYMPFSVRLGRHVVFRHGTYGVFISHGATIGNGVVILHHTTIGSNVDSTDPRSPIIEDDVFIGVGAVIIGPITIGRGAKIGANATVVEDVPPGVTAVSPKARPLLKRDTLGS